MSNPDEVKPRIFSRIDSPLGRAIDHAKLEYEHRQKCMLSKIISDFRIEIKTDFGVDALHDRMKHDKLLPQYSEVQSLTQRVQELEDGKVCEFSKDGIHYCGYRQLGTSYPVITTDKSGDRWFHTPDRIHHMRNPKACPFCGGAIQEKNSGGEG